ncbi:MAG: hypothetical protein GY712_06230, partial [Oceanicoccus sp.]|uniref:hypothetical protein n=1 Tax=Oceanicoccus sp. TaxID=2691044 RepID=UPI0026228DC8
KMAEEFVRITNDQGAFFPAAGRNGASKYHLGSNSGFQHEKLIYILTGMGRVPSSSSYVTAAIATSGVDFEDVANGWTSSIDTTYNFGHHWSSSVNDSLWVHDKTAFQWSYGGYMHPDLAGDTGDAWEYYGMDENEAMGFLTSIPNFASWVLGLGGDIAATFTRSSILCQATFNLYKDHGSVLHSNEDYYGGYFGWQQWPWVATVGDIAVWTQSGTVTTEWGHANGQNCNNHLPKVFQDGNVALIIYFPNPAIGLYS